MHPTLACYGLGRSMSKDFTFTNHSLHPMCMKGHPSTNITTTNWCHSTSIEGSYRKGKQIRGTLTSPSLVACFLPSLRRFGLDVWLSWVAWVSSNDVRPSGLCFLATSYNVIFSVSSVYAHVYNPKPTHCSQQALSIQHLNLKKWTETTKTQKDPEPNPLKWCKEKAVFCPDLFESHLKLGHSPSDVYLDFHMFSSNSMY